MKILKILLFFTINFLFSQNKDSINLKPNFELGKIYKFEITHTYDGYYTELKKINKLNEESKTLIELKFLQKLGSDFLFSWKIIDKNIHISSINKTDLLNPNLRVKLEIIFKVDSKGKYAEIINQPNIYYQLTKDINEDFIDKVKKDNKNVKIDWNQFFNNYKKNLITNLDFFEAEIKFFFQYCNVELYKGKSYFSNLRKNDKSIPIKEKIEFSENNEFYMVKFNDVLENQYLLPKDYNAIVNSQFPNFDTFKKKYTYQSEGIYFLDKNTNIPTLIEAKHEESFDTNGNMNIDTSKIKFITN